MQPTSFTVPAFFYLPVADLQLRRDLGSEWELGGPHDLDSGDGVSNFTKVLVRANNPRYGKESFLQAVCQPSGFISGEERIRRHQHGSFYRLADVLLGWNLLNQEAQTILRYIRDEHEVGWIEFLHRPLLNKRDGHRYSFYLREGAGGVWNWHVLRLALPRNAEQYAMVL